MKRIAIIGAGLAGISAARRLKDAAEVTVFDKSRGIGGRLATRYADPFKFDHGAQYFTARSPEFKAVIAPLLKDGHVRPWAPRVLTHKDQADKFKSEARFVGIPRMNVLGKKLSASLDVVTQVRIESIERLSGHWYLTDQAGKTWGQYDVVIMASPAPQTVALIPQGFADKAALNAVEMLPGFTAMLGFAGPWGGEWDAMMLTGTPISFAAVNSTKPGRDASVTCIVVQSTNAWAKERVDTDKTQVMAELLTAFQSASGVATSVAKHKVIHRWLYANVGTPAGKDFLADEAMGLYACGDWCIAGRVEAAFTSGDRLGAHLLKTL